MCAFCVILIRFAIFEKSIQLDEFLVLYGWLQKKRELSEKVLSDFIKFL
jgi:hypothetical protein